MRCTGRLEITLQGLCSGLAIMIAFPDPGHLAVETPAVSGLTRLVGSCRTARLFPPLGRCISLVTVKWVNNPTLTEFCFGMIGRADIEGSKSNVAMNAWLPQASYPCGTVIPCLEDILRLLAS